MAKKQEQKGAKKELGIEAEVVEVAKKANTQPSKWSDLGALRCNEKWANLDEEEGREKDIDARIEADLEALFAERRIMSGHNSDGRSYTEVEFKEYFSRYGSSYYVKHWQAARHPATRPICTITSALSGERIIAFKVSLPHRLSDTWIEHHHLQLGYIVDGSEPVHISKFEFTTQHHRVTMILHNPPPELVNVWRRRPLHPGWRRWYKEFRTYAMELDGEDFKDLSAHELIPYILQAWVDECRTDVADDLLLTRADDTLQIPHYRRSWDGAYHGIMRKTQSPTNVQEVMTYVQQWREKNMHVLRAINAAVRDEPCRTYFV